MNQRAFYMFKNSRMNFEFSIQDDDEVITFTTKFIVEILLKPNQKKGKNFLPPSLPISTKTINCNLSIPNTQF